LGGEFVVAPGGKGANQAVAAARAGGEVTFIARVGRDMFGDKAVEGFEKDGIHAGFVFRDPKAPSGVALIFVAQDGENSIAVASGANGRLSPADVRKARKAIETAQILVMQLETPLETVATATELALKRNVQVILNPAPARPLPDDLLAKLTFITPNESEAELLTGIKVKDAASAGKAARGLLGKGVRNVVVTLGSKGALLATAESTQLIPGFKVEPVDTTAAGDVFNGALAVGLCEGKSLAEAVRFANAAGALSVTVMGAQPSAPTRRRIDQMLRGG
jgi:ribokinase